MNYIVLISLISAICSILSFFTSKIFKSRLWIWAVVVFILTFASGYAIYINSELERINNIHRQATAIYEHHGPYSINKVFIQEVLTFLEENKDRYPDAYERAKQIYSDMKNSEFQYDSDAATELRGIIKGIATINKDK